jgi:murein DD-endopeptidase MepM/ murein hydrolase activator NlpD
METLYAHLSGFAVVAGQDVRRGDILGYVGSSGHSTGPHLHYEVRIHDTPVNPSKYLRAVPRQLASTPSTPTPASTATPASPTATGGGAD